jgi:hypothetical protein
MGWLVQEVRRRATDMDLALILRRMGYSSVRQEALARLDEVLACDRLGLGTTWFDFRFDGLGFAESLCQALGIDVEEQRAELESLANQCFEDRWAFQPWLLVDTGVHYKGEQFAPFEGGGSARQISFPVGFWRLPLVEQLASVRQTIREHSVSAAKEAALGGAVQRYLYFYDDSRAIIFSPQAEIIGECRSSQFCGWPA